MRGLTLILGLAAPLALAACSPRGADDVNRQVEAEIENQTVDIRQTVTQLAPGTTPMASSSIAYSRAPSRMKLSSASQRRKATSSSTSSAS